MVTDAAGSAYTEASSIWATNSASAWLLARGAGRILYRNAGAATIMYNYDGTSGSTINSLPSYQNRPAPFASTWGNNLIVYKDGVAGSTANYSGTMGSGNLYIGSYTGLQWGGTVREVKIFDSELTAAEVADLSPAPVPPAPAQFDWLGQNTLVPTIGDTPTFTRATSASFEDFEGLIKTVESSEPRFKGARRVENLFSYSEDFSNAAWTIGSGTTREGVVSGIGPNGEDAMELSFTAAGARYIRENKASEVGDELINTWYVAAKSGTFECMLYNGRSFSPFITLTTTFQKITAPSTPLLTSTGAIFGFYGNEAGSVYLINAQMERANGQTNQNPSEYVSTGVGTGPELVTNGTLLLIVIGLKAQAGRYRGSG